jgi:hypothetical protein
MNKRKMLHLFSVFVCVITLFVTSRLHAAPDIPTLSSAQLEAIGLKIYQNETGGNAEHLIAWNDGEAFASLGIGHFIWFPEGTISPFTETFPSLIQYFVTQGVEVPLWLQNQRYCLWQSKQDFIDARDSQKMKELRTLLANSVEHQVAFIYDRMQRALPSMLAELSKPDEISLVSRRFNDLARSEIGMYSLIDYVNFKGEGTSISERYEGEGWGLLQVLLNMAPDESNLNAAFSQACDDMLTRRVKNSPQKTVEEKWLPGWRKRCQTYR